MVNSNPETVSTDYDTSDKLYFEPLTLEDVLNIVDTEKPDGVIVQFGGQTPLEPGHCPWPRPACPSSAPARTPSTGPRTASGSRTMLHKLGLVQPDNGTATTGRGGAPGGRNASATR